MQNFDGVILKTQKIGLDKLVYFKNLDCKKIRARIFNCNIKMNKYNVISFENFKIYREDQKMTELSWIPGESKIFLGEEVREVIKSESYIKQLQWLSAQERKLNKKQDKNQNKIQKYYQKNVQEEEFQSQQEESNMKLEENQTKQEEVQIKQEEIKSKCESLIKQEETQNKQILKQVIESEKNQNSIEKKKNTFRESAQLNKFYNQKEELQNVQEENQNKIDELQKNQEPINGQAQLIGVQTFSNNQEQRRKYIVVIYNRQ